MSDTGLDRNPSCVDTVSMTNAQNILPPARVPAFYTAKFVAASRNPSPGGSLASGLCLYATPAKFDTGRVHGPVDARPSDDSAPCKGCGYRYSCRCEPAPRERLVAPRATLSQIRTLAAFESLTGYLTEVTSPDLGRMLRLNISADDTHRTGVAYVDVTVDGGAFIRSTDGSETFVSREESRAILRDLLNCGA